MHNKVRNMVCYCQLYIFLNQLEQHDCYNPLLVHSGLYQGLTALSNSTRRGQLSKTTTNTRGTFQPPVQVDKSMFNLTFAFHVWITLDLAY